MTNEQISKELINMLIQDKLLIPATQARAFVECMDWLNEIQLGRLVVVPAGLSPNDSAAPV